MVKKSYKSYAELTKQTQTTIDSALLCHIIGLPKLAGGGDIPSGNTAEVIDYLREAFTQDIQTRNPKNPYWSENGSEYIRLARQFQKEFTGNNDASANIVAVVGLLTNLPQPQVQQTKRGGRG